MAEHYEKCDVCSAPDATWIYPARDFAFVPGLCNSQGNWVVCPVCRDLIEANDRTALAYRAVASMVDMGSIPPEQAAECIMLAKLVHEDFFDNRTGPAVEVRQEVGP